MKLNRRRCVWRIRGGAGVELRKAEGASDCLVLGSRRRQGHAPRSRGRHTVAKPAQCSGVVLIGGYPVWVRPPRGRFAGLRRAPAPSAVPPWCRRRITRVCVCVRVRAGPSRSGLRAQQLGRPACAFDLSYQSTSIIVSGLAGPGGALSLPPDSRRRPSASGALLTRRATRPPKGFAGDCVIKSATIHLQDSNKSI